LILEAQKKLKEEKIFARVVSMPSWDLFEKQTQSYRDDVLPPSITKRLAVEAASKFGWEKWTGNEGDVIGMESFGASAPDKDLFKEFGFTAENVISRAKKLLGK
jgi:transketolase